MIKKTKHNTPLYFLPLGGSNEIGMNLNLYGYNDQWIMVDLGVTFGSDLGVEVLMPDPAFIVERRKKLLGLVLTHAHEDHIGAVPYLWERLKCPIYATPFTLWLVKEKLKEVGLNKEVSLIEIPLGGSLKLGEFNIEFIDITHSIPEPNVLAIKTPYGTIVHTGDWKVDPAPMLGKSTDIKALKNLGDEGVLALVCDSTNVFVEGRSGSEADVREKLIDLVAKQTGRVFIACFASNVARLETCALAAKKAGRKAALVGRSLSRMDQAARQSGYLKDIDSFLGEEDVKKIERSKSLIICTGSQGEPRSALARIASGQHPRVKIEQGDSVIFSSRMIPGNEDAIKRLQENLIEAGAIVINASYEDDIHVSGHPARDELKDMYKWVKPEILVPVHGEQAHLREHAAFGHENGIKNTIVPHNGSLIQLAPGKPKIVDDIGAARLALDGEVIVPFSGIQMRDRHRLMNSGVVFVSATLSRSHMLKGVPEITMLGVVEEGSEEETIEVIQDALQHAFTKAENLEDREDAQELIRITTRRVMNSLRGKKPPVVVHLL